MYNNYVNNSAPGQGGVVSADEVSALALLQHLEKDDLQNLLDDPDKLEALIQDAVQGITNEKKNILANNKSLAEYNLSLQPKFDDLKRRVATGYEEINNHKTELGKDKARLDALIGEQSLDTVLALLQTETAKSEEKSEQMADDFCATKLSVDEFMSKYIAERTIGHARRVKVDKMMELLRNLHAENHPMLHQQQNMAPSGVASSWQSGSSQTPYPTTASRMPQPGYF